MFDYGFHQLRPKVQIRKFKSFVICTAYRTDDVPLSCFENDLLFSLNSAMSWNIPVFILADVNCNMLWPDAKEAKVLHDFCDSFNLTQVINKPKKLLSSSSPLLTLLLLKKQTWQRKHKLFHTQISDHELIIFAILQLKKPRPKSVYITTRSFKNYIKDTFLKDISNVPWFILDTFDNVEDFRSTWASEHCKTVWTRPTPFIDDNVCALMKTGDHWQKLARQTN